MATESVHSVNPRILAAIKAFVEPGVAARMFQLAHSQTVKSQAKLRSKLAHFDSFKVESVYPIISGGEEEVRRLVSGTFDPAASAWLALK